MRLIYNLKRALETVRLGMVPRHHRPQVREPKGVIVIVRSDQVELVEGKWAGRGRIRDPTRTSKCKYAAYCVRLLVNR